MINYLGFAVMAYIFFAMGQAHELKKQRRKLYVPDIEVDRSGRPQFIVYDAKGTVETKTGEAGR